MAGTDQDLAPLVPNGRSPVAIERAFQVLNSRVENLRSLLLGPIVLNDAGQKMYDDDGNFLRTAAILG